MMPQKLYPRCFQLILLVAYLPSSILMVEYELIDDPNLTSNLTGHHTFSLEDNGFVVVFQAYNNSVHRDLYGRRYNADLTPYAGTFKVSDRLDEEQGFPTGVGLSNGGYLIVYEDYYDATRLYDIYGVVYDSSSGKVGSEFKISTTNDVDTQGFPYPCRMTNNKVIVAWHSILEDNGSTGVYAKLFDEDGSTSEGYFQMNTANQADAQDFVSVSPLSGGGFVGSWTDTSGLDGDGNGIFARRFDASGTQLGSETQANQDGSGYQQNSFVVGLSNGGFVVCYDSENINGGPFQGVACQIFTAADATVGSEFKPHTDTAKEQFNPRLVAFSDGGFIVTYQERASGSDWDIYARRYDNAGNVVSTEGNPTGNPFLINEYTSGNQEAAEPASTGDGGYVVTWVDINRSILLYFRKFDPEDIPVDYDSVSIATESTASTFCTENTIGIQITQGSFNPKATWTVTSTSYKNTDLEEDVIASGSVNILEVPISLLEYDFDYQFTATYMHRDFTFDLENVKCGNDVFAEQSTITVELTTPSDTCSGLTVSLDLSSEEWAYWDSIVPVVDWTYTSNSSTPNTDIEPQLQGETGLSFALSIDKLQPHTEYEFTATLLTGTIVSETYVTGSLIQYSIDSSFSTRPTDALYIPITGFTKCLVAEDTTTTVITSDGVEIQAYLDGGITEIDIPACAFDALTDYNYEIKTSYDNYNSHSTKSDTFTISVGSEPYTIQISDAETSQLAMILTVDHTYTDDCTAPSNSGFTYTWYCQNATDSDSGPYESCPTDDSDLFGVEYNSNELLLPRSYRQLYVHQKLTVVVERGEESVEEDFILSNSYLEIVESDTPTRCSVSLEAEVSSIDATIVGKVYNWWLVSSDSSQVSNTAAIQNYLATQSQYTLSLPVSLIESNVQYEFGCWSLNQGGSNTSSTLELSTKIPKYPEIEFQNGEDQTLSATQVNIIKATPSCLEQELSYKWKISSGPTFAISSMSYPGVPQWLKLPACTLMFGQEYELSLEVSLDGVSPEDIDLTVTVQEPEFSTVIVGGGGDHPVTLDLKLNATILIDGACPIDYSRYEYSWSCQTANLGESSAACSDPTDIYGETSNDPAITVPKSSLTKNTNLQFTLDTSIGGLSAESVSIVAVKGPGVIPMTITCTSLTCSKYSPTQRIQFASQATQQVVDYSKLNYVWQVAPSIPFTSFQNQITFKALTTTPDYDGETSIIISVSASNTTNTASATYTIPINESPKSGSVSSNPTSGTSLQTQFTISSTGWVDDDIPLQYQFAYSKSQSASASQLTLLTGISIASSVKTWLPSDGSNVKLYITGFVIDTLGGKSNKKITVTVSQQEFSDTSQAAENLQGALDSIDEIQDPQQKVEQLRLVGSSIKALDTQTNANKDSGKCECNGNGKCVDDKCECNEGYKLSDCSLSEDKFDEIQAVKQNALEELEKSLDQLGSDANKEISLSLLQDLSADPELNSEDTMLKTQDVLNKIVNGDPDTPLSASESEKVATTVDQMIAYAGSTDCDATGEVTDQLREDTQNYLSRMAEGFLDETIVGDEPVIEISDNYNIYVKKTTECSISDDLIEFGDGVSPEIRVTPKADEPDCSKQLILKVYVFNGKIFDCKGEGSDLKEKIIIEVLDVEGNDLADQFEVSYKLPDGSEEGCPSDCSTKQDGSCLCEDLGLFEVGGQLRNIFANSNLSKAVNFDAFANYDFYKSLGFWFIVGMIFSFGISAYILKKVIPNYCVMDKLDKTRSPSKRHIFGYAFVVVHPFLSVFMLNREANTKIVRSMILFARIFFILIFVAIFGADAFTVGDRLLQEEQQSEEGENEAEAGSGFNIYMLILPYFTFVPIISVLSMLINLEIHDLPDNMDPKKRSTLEKKNKRNKKLRVVGFVMTGVLTTAAIFFMFTLDANFNFDERVGWITGFAQALAQDWVLTPLLFVFFQLKEINENVAEIIKRNHEIEKKKRLTQLKRMGISMDDVDHQNTQKDLITQKEEEEQPSIERDIPPLINGSRPHSNNGSSVSVDVENPANEDPDKLIKDKSLKEAVDALNSSRHEQDTGKNMSDQDHQAKENRLQEQKENVFSVLTLGSQSKINLALTISDFTNKIGQTLKNEKSQPARVDEIEFSIDPESTPRDSSSQNKLTIEKENIQSEDAIMNN